MRGLDLNDFDERAVLDAIQTKTIRLREAMEGATAEYVEWVSGLREIGMGNGVEPGPEGLLVPSRPEKPGDGAASPPPSEPAPSPTPAPRSTPAEKALRVNAVVDAFAHFPREWKRRVEIEPYVPGGPSVDQVKEALKTALSEGRLESQGANRWTTYRRRETMTPVSEGRPADHGPKAETEEMPVGMGHKSTVAHQTPTLQGRILASLQMGQKRMEDLVGELEAPENTVRAAVGRLLREREIRTTRDHGYTVYGLAA